MNPLRLRKTRSRRVFDRDLPSALWEVVDVPNLYLSRHNESSGSNYKQLHWSFIADQYALTSNTALQGIIDQQFATRKEALQALEAALMLEEDAQ